MKWRIVVVLTVIATISSCIFTFHPLYSDDVLVDIPGLEGMFVDFDSFTQDSSNWTFTREGKGTYSLEIIQDGHSGIMDVHAVTLGGEFFLDFSVDDIETDAIPDFIEFHLVPMHSFSKVQVLDDRLVMHFIDMEWDEDNLESHRIRIDHERRLSDGNTEFILLTASTRDLQKFVAKYARYDEAFEDEPDVLNRVIAK